MIKFVAELVPGDEVNFGRGIMLITATQHLGDRLSILFEDGEGVVLHYDIQVYVFANLDEERKPRPAPEPEPEPERVEWIYPYSDANACSNGGWNGM